MRHSRDPGSVRPSMWLRTWGPWLLGVAAAVAALTQKLCPQARVVFWATVTVAAVSIASSALAFWSGRIAAKAKAHDDALRALHEALVRLVAKLNVPFDDLGLHVYRRRRTLRCQLGYEHVRIVRLRLDSSIAPSGVIWKAPSASCGRASTRNRISVRCWEGQPNRFRPPPRGPACWAA